MTATAGPAKGHEGKKPPPPGTSVGTEVGWGTGEGPMPHEDGQAFAALSPAM